MIVKDATELCKGNESHHLIQSLLPGARLLLRNLWLKECDPCISAVDLLSHQRQGDSAFQGRGTWECSQWEGSHVLLCVAASLNLQKSGPFLQTLLLHPQIRQHRGNGSFFAYKLLFTITQAFVDDFVFWGVSLLNLQFHFLNESGVSSGLGPWN